MTYFCSKEEEISDVSPLQPSRLLMWTTWTSSVSGKPGSIQTLNIHMALIAEKIA
jgi:hypothetical protein